MTRIFLASISGEEINQLDLNENIINFQELSRIEDPLFWLSIGIFICLISGIIFSDIIRTKIRSWKDERISPIPLGNPQSISSWFAFHTGLTIIFTSALNIFSFSVNKSIIFSLAISLLFGISMWKAIKDLMVQIKSGTIKEIEDFF